MQEAPAVSVRPYASEMGAQKHILRKSRTSLSIGADPEDMLRTLPPRIALVFLNTRASQHTWVSAPDASKEAYFEATALSTSHFLHPVAASKLDFSALKILLYNLGTEGKNCGLRI